MKKTSIVNKKKKVAFIPMICETSFLSAQKMYAVLFEEENVFLTKRGKSKN